MKTYLALCLLVQNSILLFQDQISMQATIELVGDSWPLCIVRTFGSTSICTIAFCTNLLLLLQLDRKWTNTLLWLTNLCLSRLYVYHQHHGNDYLRVLSFIVLILECDRFIVYQAAYMYVSTGYLKLQGNWQTTNVLNDVFRIPYLSNDLGKQLLKYPNVLLLFTRITPLLEIALGLALLFPRLNARIPLVLFHMSCLFSMQLGLLPVYFMLPLLTRYSKKVGIFEFALFSLFVYHGDFILFTFGMEQYWCMFAPYPPINFGTVEIKGTKVKSMETILLYVLEGLYHNHSAPLVDAYFDFQCTTTLEVVTIATNVGRWRRICY